MACGSTTVARDIAMLATELSASAVILCLQLDIVAFSTSLHKMWIGKVIGGLSNDEELEKLA